MKYYYLLLISFVLVSYSCEKKNTINNTEYVYVGQENLDDFYILNVDTTLLNRSLYYGQSEENGNFGRLYLEANEDLPYDFYFSNFYDTIYEDSSHKGIYFEIKNFNMKIIVDSTKIYRYTCLKKPIIEGVENEYIIYSPDELLDGSDFIEIKKETRPYYKHPKIFKYGEVVKGDSSVYRNWMLYSHHNFPFHNKIYEDGKLVKTSEVIDDQYVWVGEKGYIVFRYYIKDAIKIGWIKIEIPSDDKIYIEKVCLQK